MSKYVIHHLTVQCCYWCICNFTSHLHKINLLFCLNEDANEALCTQYKFTYKQTEAHTHVASTAPGLTTTSTLYFIPVSNLMVLVWPNLVPSDLKNTGPLFGVVFSETPILISWGMSAMMMQKTGRCEETGQDISGWSKSVYSSGNPWKPHAESTSKVMSAVPVQ